MPLTFAANISTMFTEYEFLERFDKAKKAGFKHVEIQSLYQYNAKEVEKAKSGLSCFLINSYCDENMGLSSVPGNECEFLKDLHKITPYLHSLGIQRVHIMGGMLQKNFSFEEQLDCYKSNLNSAVEYLETQDIVGVIEPICPAVKENYFMSSFEIAKEVVEYVNSDYLKLLLDIYHLHKIEGNVMKNLEKYYPLAGHIQVSQDPGRTEPFLPGGQIPYDRVFQFLMDKNYAFPIGLEYFPSGATIDSLGWMQNYN